jgi:hypothetical protein
MTRRMEGGNHEEDGYPRIERQEEPNQDDAPHTGLGSRSCTWDGRISDG